MKPNTRLSCAVFQLTPTRTRCDLVLIANDKKEKIASGLLNPFLAQLKVAREQIAKGGYSILLEPPNDTDALWFRKATVERFVRFVSTPEILERVYAIETEIIQIEEAIVMQSSNDTWKVVVDDNQLKPQRVSEGDKSVPSVHDEKALVLYQPLEADGSCSPETDSKLHLLTVLETRKKVLLQEQGMAFARAVAAGFDIDYMDPLVSFAHCFGATRLMEACSRFVDLRKSKHEKGQWFDVKASESAPVRPDLPAMNASENTGKLSSPNNPTDNQAAEDYQQKYFQGQFPHLVFPSWPMHAPLQAYSVQGMPYYHTYPFLHPMEHSLSNFAHDSEQRSRSDMALDTEDSCNHKSRKSNKKTSVVVRNINFVTSKEKKRRDDETDSGSLCSETDRGSEGCDVIHQSSVDELKSDGDDNRQWQAFQNCLLRESAEDARANDEGVFLMERGVRMMSRHTNSTVDDDPWARGGARNAVEHDSTVRDMHSMSGITSKPRRLGGGDLCSHGGNGLSEKQGQADIRFAESNRRKVLQRSGDEDFVMGSQLNQPNLGNSLAVNSFEGSTDETSKESLRVMADETFIVPFRSMSLDRVNGDVEIIDAEISSGHQKSNNSETNEKKLSFEPDCLSLIPERGAEKNSPGYDHALDYELLNRSEAKVRKHVDAKGKKSKVALDSMQRQKNSGGPLKTVMRSKMSPSDDARARAERLRSYKADLQRKKKENEDEEAKRLEKLKLERQKRIAARGKPNTLSPQTKQLLLPAKTSPAANPGSKFSDSEPGSSSPLQRSKVRKSLDNRLTRSASSSFSEPKKESKGMTPDLDPSKASMARIRRLSEPKTITYPSSIASMKSRSVDAAAAAKHKFSDGAKKNKMTDAIIDLDRSKAASLPELKIRTSPSLVNSGGRKTVEDENVTRISDSYGIGLNTQPQIDAAESPVLEKTVVMLEMPSAPMFLEPEIKSERCNQMLYDNDKGERSKLVSASDSEQATANGVHRETMSSQLQTQSVSNEEPPANSQQPRAEETVAAHFNMAKKFIAAEKNFVKESSKGLRNLLKFGKKRHPSTSADQSFDSQCSSRDDGVEHDNHAKNVALSSEVNTLKNLIFQDQTSNAPQKASRHFSLFSPFRCKMSERKQAS